MYYYETMFVDFLRVKILKKSLHGSCLEMISSVGMFLISILNFSKVGVRKESICSPLPPAVFPKTFQIFHLEYMKISFASVNYFYQFFGFFDISLLQIS